MHSLSVVGCSGPDIRSNGAATYPQPDGRSTIRPSLLLAAAIIAILFAFRTGNAYSPAAVRPRFEYANAADTRDGQAKTRALSIFVTFPSVFISHCFIINNEISRSRYFFFHQTNVNVSQTDKLSYENTD